MKAFHQLNPPEKTALLFRLFPEALPDFLAFLEDTCTEFFAYLNTHPEVDTTTDDWQPYLQQLGMIHTVIRQQRAILLTHTEAFGRTLVTEPLEPLMIHFLLMYAILHQEKNDKCAKAIQLLFDR